MAFGGSNIPQELFDFIRKVLPEGSTILEFGSGAGSTGELSKHYKMVSIEHDSRFVGKYQSHYIHAPLRGRVAYESGSRFVVPHFSDPQTGWYDLDAVKKVEGIEYDLVLIDGPIGEGNRLPVLNHLDILDLKGKWIIVDDTCRTGEIILFHELLRRLPNQGAVVFDDFSAMKVKE